MAIDRNKFDVYIGLIESIASRYSGFDIKNGSSNIVQLKENFDIKVMVVGHFNAGKSSLLNELIGIPDFLEEAQIPQTAIATELVYDEKFASYAFNNSGEIEPMVLSQNYYPDRYKKLLYHVPSPGLKEIQDFTIVDTPGIDSGIENHIKALSQYIGKGSAFIVVVDQEKGGIDNTLLGFIEEISRYSRGQVAILINKCDKITEDIRDDIVMSARRTLESRFMSFPVFAVSRFDKGIADTLIQIINRFQAQDAFDFIIKQNLRNEMIEMKRILENSRILLCLDTFDLETEIAKNKKIKNELENSLIKRQEEYLKNIDNKTEEIINQIKDALIEQADGISFALLNDNEIAAQSIITETLRPIMLSISKKSSTDLIDSISKDIRIDNAINSVAFKDVALSFAEKLKDMIKSGTFESRLKNNNSSNVFSSKNIRSSKIRKHNQSHDIYHLGMGILSICTDVIAPWMEIVIILAPDIISIVSSIFSESDIEQTKKLFTNTSHMNKRQKALF